MHEASLALSILETVCRQCATEGHETILSIHLRIGNASGVMTDSLCFAFDAAKINTIARDASLEIEKIPLGGTCQACRQEFSTAMSYILECPHCQQQEFKITRGFEMEIVDMEVE